MKNSLLRPLFLLLIAAALSACGDSPDSVLGTCELIDRETDEVVETIEDITENACQNRALESELDVTFEWEAGDAETL